MFEAFTKYAQFSDRSRRKEFWLFYLLITVATIVLTVIDISIGTFDDSSGFGLLSGIFSLAIIVPSIAVGVRRLHDTDRSGWWLLLSFIPLLGTIVLVVFWCLRGTDGSNKFGDDPLGSKESDIKDNRDQTP